MTPKQLSKGEVEAAKNVAVELLGAPVLQDLSGADDDAAQMLIAFGAACYCYGLEHGKAQAILALTKEVAHDNG